VVKKFFFCFVLIFFSFAKISAIIEPQVQNAEINNNDLAPNVAAKNMTEIPESIPKNEQEDTQNSGQENNTQPENRNTQENKEKEENKEKSYLPNEYDLLPKSDEENKLELPEVQDSEIDEYKNMFPTHEEERKSYLIRGMISMLLLISGACLMSILIIM
jgi:hypothetical protein